MIDAMTLDAQGLKARLDSETPPLLLDVTPEDRFNAVRLPGAMNACVYLMQFLGMHLVNDHITLELTLVAS